MDDRWFNQAVVGTTVVDQAALPLRSYRTEQEAAEYTAQFVLDWDAGLVLLVGMHQR